MSDLFDFNNVRVADNQSQPLSHRLRPQKLKDLIGQDHITSKTGPIYNIIKNISSDPQTVSIRVNLPGASLVAGNLLVDKHFLVIDKIPGSLTGSQVLPAVCSL